MFSITHHIYLKTEVIKKKKPLSKTDTAWILYLLMYWVALHILWPKTTGTLHSPNTPWKKKITLHKKKSILPLEFKLRAFPTEGRKNEISSSLQTVVFYSCYNKLSQTWWLKTTQVYYPTVLKVRSLKSVSLG